MNDERLDEAPNEKLSTGGGLPRGVYVWAILGAVLAAAGVIALGVAIFTAPATRRGYGYAVASVRTIATGQNNWRSSDYDGNGVYDYTPQYRNLYYQPVGGIPVAIIDRSIAGASGPNGTPKNGYLFVDITGDADGPYDHQEQFGVCAYPAKYEVWLRNRYGIPRERLKLPTYITNEMGRIYKKDNGGKPVTVWPDIGLGTYWLIAQ